MVRNIGAPVAASVVTAVLTVLLLRPEAQEDFGGGTAPLDYSPAVDQAGLMVHNADLQDRLERLEREVEDLRQAASGRTRVPAKAEEPLPEQAALPALPRVEALRAIALDSEGSTLERVSATARLWRMDLETGTEGARTPEIVDGLLARLDGEPSAELRRDICFNVLGAVSDRHTEVLMRTLELDVSDEVRAQAADTLQDLVGLPGVRSALEWSQDNDASELVRDAATEMLRRWDEGE